MCKSDKQNIRNAVYDPVKITGYTIHRPHNGITDKHEKNTEYHPLKAFFGPGSIHFILIHREENDDQDDHREKIHIYEIYHIYHTISTRVFIN